MTTTREDAALLRLLESESVVVPADAWAQQAANVEEVERHATGLAGDLVLIRVGDTLAAVEAPEPGVRVVRRLGTPTAAAEFVTRRLGQYERMWEGCGCRIDYYE